ESPHIRAITPVLATNDVHAVSEFASASGQLTGAEPQYNGIRFLPLKQGRWLNDLDEVQKRNVVGRGDENSTNTRCYIPFQVMRSDFPVKGEEAFDAISFLNYQPRVADEHL